jgi:hypothetical protein
MKHLKLFSLGLLYSTLILGAAEALAEDPKNASVQIPLPQIILNDIFFQAQVHEAEEEIGGADPLLWTIGAKTNFASWADVQASVGAPQLLYRPSWNPLPNNQSVAIVDLVATLHSILGDFYAGQALVPWGLEGQSKESNLWLPRSLLYENGAFPLRDVGVGLHSEADGFYMNVMAHNGEGGDTGNLDNRMFLTAQWGLIGPNNTNFGVSATAGRVAPPLVTTEEHVRGGNVFLTFSVFGLGFQGEGSYIQYISTPQTVDTFAWHGDVQCPINTNINLIGRYEQFNPNTRVSSSIQGRGYAGGEYHSKNNSSRLFLFFVKNTQSLSDIPDDQVQLAWRLTPPFEM